MIRVTTKQFSKLSNQKVFTRSDAYLIISNSFNLIILLQNENGYLDEDILYKNNIQFNFVPKSGVSIKLNTSSRFQILKVGPKSFNKMFGSYELGAGASLFCLRKDELYKNEKLINSWNTTNEKMNIVFKKLLICQADFTQDKIVCETVKKYSHKKIIDLVNESKELQKKILMAILFMMNLILLDFFPKVLK